MWLQEGDEAPLTLVAAWLCLMGQSTEAIMLEVLRVKARGI